MTALFFIGAVGAAGYLLGAGYRGEGAARTGLTGRGGGAARTGITYDPEYLAALLESLALCTEAGMEPSLALESMLAGAPPHPFGDEVRTALRETRAGATAEESWRRLAERVPADDVKLTVSLLVQSGRLGSGLTGSLRGLAEGIRERAYRSAEKRALEAPVKLLLPMLGVFASILVVIIGALVLDISTQGVP